MVARAAAGKENARPREAVSKDGCGAGMRSAGHGRQALAPCTTGNLQQQDADAKAAVFGRSAVLSTPRRTQRIASEPKLPRAPVQVASLAPCVRSRSAAQLDVADGHADVENKEVPDCAGALHDTSSGLNVFAEVHAILGDPDLLLPLLRTRPNAAKFDFRKKMADQEQLLRDLKEALDQQRSRQLGLPQSLEPFQERVDACLRAASESRATARASEVAAASAREEAQHSASRAQELEEELRAIRSEAAELERQLKHREEAHRSEVEQRQHWEACLHELRSQMTALQAELGAAQDREHKQRLVAAQQEEREAQLQRMNIDLRENLRGVQEMHRSNCEQVQFERERTRELEQRLRESSQSEDALRERLRAAAVELDRREADLSSAKKRELELQAALKAADEEKERVEAVAAEEQATAQKLQTNLAAVEADLSKAKQAHEAACSDLEAATARADALAQEKLKLEVEFRSYKEHHGTSDQQQLEAISDLRMTVERLNNKMETSKSELLVQQGDVEQKTIHILSLEKRLSSAEQARRELHNQIQELKGNIRVLCRVRPGMSTACFGPSEAASLRIPDSAKISMHFAGENYQFNFDKVFVPTAQQDDIFEEVSGLVQSALDGFKVCIFAYGQTGSGKTYTMQGLQEPRSWGIIPRALKKIFEECQASHAQGWEWTLQASFMEVYNEQIRDLLRTEGNGGVSPRSANQANSAAAPVHVIKQDEAWGTMVTNMSSVEVSSMAQISSLMAKAARQRAVGCTDMNAVSSRSHSIFALYLRGTHQGQGSELLGALHLVDLAGSERLDRSGATGERLKETQNINRSLSSLADVFLAKAEGRTHVPFRNSKLTHLMEPCLSGQGKTVMLVNISPEDCDLHETLCSLRFAGQVSQCDTGGKPKRSAKALQAANAAAGSTSAAGGGGGFLPSSAGQGNCASSAACRPATPTRAAAAPFGSHTARRARG